MLHLLASLAVCAVIGDHASLSTAQPARTTGSVPIVSDVPLAQIDMSFRISRAHNAEALGDLRVCDAEGNTVRQQGSERARVLIGEGLVLLPSDEHTLEVLSSPRLLVIAGQTGEIIIGQRVPYAELIGDGGTMQLVADEHVFEGLTIEAAGGPTSTGAVRFRILDVGLSVEAGRLDPTDESGAVSTAIPAGRPLMITTTFRMPITLNEGESAVILLAPNGDDGDAFVVEVDARMILGE